MALDSEGQVYTWGANEYGQCGHPPPRHALATSNDVIMVPKVVELFRKRGERVSQIVCGSNHSLAHVRGSELYSWGFNKYG